MLFKCTIAKEFWESLGFWLPNYPTVHCLLDLELPPAAPMKLHSTILLLCCRQLWLHRHDVVFRGLRPCRRRLLSACQDTCKLWANRLKVDDRWILHQWCNHFTPSSQPFSYPRFWRLCNLAHEPLCLAPSITGLPGSIENI